MKNLKYKQDQKIAAEKRIWELISLLNTWEKENPIPVTDGSEKIFYYQLAKFTKPKTTQTNGN